MAPHQGTMVANNKLQEGYSYCCCNIAEAQITKIDYENILDLRNIFKITIGTKKINPNEK